MEYAPLPLRLLCLRPLLLLLLLLLLFAPCATTASFSPPASLMGLGGWLVGRK